MTERIQLNLRFDGHADLIQAIKDAASSQGVSVNRFVIDTLKSALGLQENEPATAVSTPTLDKKLDTMLDSKLASILDEKLDKRIADVMSDAERLLEDTRQRLAILEDEFAGK